MVRNAIYAANIERQCPNDKYYARTVSSSHKFLSKSMSRGMLSQSGKNIQNQTFYSFGGRTPLSNSMNKRPQMNQTFTSIAESLKRENMNGVNVIHKEPLVNVQDYTKNISQSIFSPGLVVK